MNLDILKNSSLRKRERKKENLKDRLLKKVHKNPENNCWEWIGYRIRQGHGRIGYRDKVYLTHRLSYEIFIGKIPNNLCVCHKCDNPCCINPDHLFLGTQQDNINDMIKKKRNFNLPPMYGEKNPIAKITNTIAKEIKNKLKLGYKGIEIAKEYNISVHIVSRIKSGKRYNI